MGETRIKFDTFTFRLRLTRNYCKGIGWREKHRDFSESITMPSCQTPASKAVKSFILNVGILCRNVGQNIIAFAGGIVGSFMKYVPNTNCRELRRLVSHDDFNELFRVNIFLIDFHFIHGTSESDRYKYVNVYCLQIAINRLLGSQNPMKS